MGCPCHAQELAENKKVECKRIGRNLKFAHAIVRDWQDDASTTRRDLSIHLANQPQSYLVEVAFAFTGLIADTHLKFDYLASVPFLVWRLDEPAMALAFIENYDAACSTAGGKAAMHRVGHRFGSADGFRDNMIIWGKSQIMSSPLRTAITSYQLGRSDEGPGEALHSLVSGLVKAKASSTSMYWSANMNFDRNLELYDECVARGRFHNFENAYNNWKVLKQCDLKRYSNWQGCRIKTQLFLEQVYCTGDSASTNWLELGRAVKHFV
jgi:hypothetical protein